ncbi:2Fe-2S iron-sulfur cluster binding domain-containing protein [Massilia sp. NEAU-DD11]|uniref:2Fe-2S iron-sulfur cluster binding domain-containing protein n=1 Tax=Massilia cellulosiltytica TaxID=2683234 RepID=A0A7X3K9U6_9BURK|nr:PDR/VanB family oxidoreductase [Telluria cellulosilytica]MVW62927.1 2Fe-2S iron-sulfur cluster binding domain-containing protein [Telluria cellulosilytica]
MTTSAQPTTRYRIATVLAHGPVVKEFRLVPVDGAAVPPWQPGAHVELVFASRTGIRHRNAYSIVGAAAGALRIAVQREADGRGGSRTLHDEFAPGMELEVGAPRDDFRLQPGARRTILIAGGIGITPIVPMAHALDAAGAAYELHYIAKDADRLVLLDDLRGLAGAIHTHVTGSGGRPDLDVLVGPYEAGCELHACGPSGLLQAIAERAAALGWPPRHVRFESFGARNGGADQPVRVYLRQSDMVLDVAPGQSILDAMIAADVFVSYECRRGECGNCYAGVLSGAPVHRDVCLTGPQRAQGMTTCVSWASTPELELDL